MKTIIILIAIFHAILHQATVLALISLKTMDIKCSEKTGTPISLTEILGENVPNEVKKCISLMCDEGKVIALPKTRWCQDNLPTIENQKYDHASPKSEAERSTTTQATTTETTVASTIGLVSRMKMPPFNPNYSSTTEEPMDYAADREGDESQLEEGDQYENTLNSDSTETTYIETTEPTEPTATTTTKAITSTKASFSSLGPISTSAPASRPASPTISTTASSTISTTASPTIPPKASTTSLVELIAEAIAKIPKRPKSKNFSKVKSNTKLPKRINYEADLGVSVAEVRAPDESLSQFPKYLRISLPDLLILILICTIIFLMMCVIGSLTYCVKKVFRKKKVQVVVGPQTPRTCLSNYNFDV